MKNELLIDLCARVPYHPRGRVVNRANGDECDEWLTCATFDMFASVMYNCRLYLRPMSSMTEEEVEEIRQLLNDSECGRYINEDNFRAEPFGVLWFYNMKCYECVGHTMMSIVIDWLNAHHFDFRNLIERGMALEAPEDMYKEDGV